MRAPTDLATDLDRILRLEAPQVAERTWRDVVRDHWRRNGRRWLTAAAVIVVATVAAIWASRETERRSLDSRLNPFHDLLAADAWQESDEPLIASAWRDIDELRRRSVSRDQAATLDTAEEAFRKYRDDLRDAGTDEVRRGLPTDRTGTAPLQRGFSPGRGWANLSRFRYATQALIFSGLQKTWRAENLDPSIDSNTPIAETAFPRLSFEDPQQRLNGGMVRAVGLDLVQGMPDAAVTLGELPWESPRPIAPGYYVIHVRMPDGREAEFVRSFDKIGREVVIPVGPRTLDFETSDMITIPAGPARVGYDLDNESAYPIRTIRLPEFRIDRCEVTCREWLVYARETGARMPWGQENDYSSDWDDLPISRVSWLEAQRFAEYYGKRLPTWTEWQKAARGPEGHLFPWGNDHWDEAHQRAVVGRRDRSDRRRGWELTVAYVEPVGKTSGDRSDYGVMDMLGNVAEWTCSPFLHTVEGEPYVNLAARIAVGLSWSRKLTKDRDADPRKPGRQRLDENTFGPVEYASEGFRCVRSVLD